MDHIAHFDSPLGGITAASDGDALIGLWFDGQKHFGAALAIEYDEKMLPVFDRTKQWLALYFSGRKPDFMPPILLRGTPFQKEVWSLLLTVPYGYTSTYGEIAAELADRRHIPKMSSRAVGSAIGHNPISLIVPCHRIIGVNGSLTGYAGGTERKGKLLRLEGIDPDNLPAHAKHYVHK